jgi:bifunctional UDP-N-acetylglucosamine pyrophosphorylase/glucosamine-1-phosphate N-acetyltransferase
MAKRNEFSGYIPQLPEQDEPVWKILDPSHDECLKNQLNTLLKQYGHVVPELPSSVSIDDSAGPICIDDRASIGECVRIEGPCYIGPNVEVRHGAYIRPYTWLCCDSVVGHASEVKHSLLLPGAKAPHFNYVGDSVLGKDVNLGAGCKLSNLRNDERSVLVRGLEGGSLDSGLRKFGAILGDGVAIGCNVVTNPGVIVGAGADIWPNLTISGVFAADSSIKE